MQRRAVGRRLIHRRHPLYALEEFLAEGAGAIVLVPVVGFGIDQSLRHLEAETVDVGNEHHDACELLAAGDDAEFRGLLDGIDGIAARVGKTDDFRFGGLRLQQERREIGCVERMPRAAEHLAARRSTTALTSRSME